MASTVPNYISKEQPFYKELCVKTCAKVSTTVETSKPKGRCEQKEAVLLPLVIVAMPGAPSSVLVPSSDALCS